MGLFALFCGKRLLDPLTGGHVDTLLFAFMMNKIILHQLSGIAIFSGKLKLPVSDSQGVSIKMGYSSAKDMAISWIPLITMEENIITAAPPRTAWGMMETGAPMMAPQAMAANKV